MNLFDIMGPIMVGPSSSHTAGAARMGRVSRGLLGQPPARAEILLHGSFASTGKGHGTHQAIVAGLLGLALDDPRIPNSFRLAKEAGMDFQIGTCLLRGAHPNSALLRLEGQDGTSLEVGASSLGGGRIRVFQLDGLECYFSGELPTLVVHNTDQPGCVSEVAYVLARRGINVATLQLQRGEEQGSNAVMVIECDKPFSPQVPQEILTLPGILRVSRYIPREMGGGV